MNTVNPSNVSDDVNDIYNLEDISENGSMYGTNRSDWFNLSDLHIDNTNIEVDPISVFGEVETTSTSNTTNEVGSVTVNEQQLRLGDIVSIQKPAGVNYKFKNADGKIVKFIKKNNKRAIIQWYCPIKKMPLSSVHNVTTLIYSPNNITSTIPLSSTHNGKVRVTTISETSTSELDDFNFQYDLTYFFTKKYSTRRRLNFNSSI